MNRWEDAFTDHIIVSQSSVEARNTKQWDAGGLHSPLVF
jgi:hypothetical protein